MDEKPDEIMSHIESQRDQLGRNLNELESRVKSAADWRMQFNKNPMLMMGVALGGGMLLGTMVGGAQARRSSRSSWSSSSSNRNYGTAGSSLSAWGDSSSSVSPAKSSSTSPTSSAVTDQRRKANETLDTIKTALIGFATAKVREFMSEALPGFNDHLDEARRSRKGSSQYASASDFSGAFDDGRESSGRSGSTHTEQSANSPYTSQGSGQNRGM
jgi:hypothetical protein